MSLSNKSLKNSSSTLELPKVQTTTTELPKVESFVECQPVKYQQVDLSSIDISIVDPHIEALNIPKFDSQFHIKDKASLRTIKNEISTKLEQIEEIIRSLETKQKKHSLPLPEVIEDSVLSEKSEVSSICEGSLVKKLKIKIKPPTSKYPTEKQHHHQSTKSLPRIGCGVKNLARAKKLSRLNSSSLDATTSDVAKQRVESQIPVALFWSLVESFFSQISEEDLKFLKENELDESLFLIPAPMYPTHMRSSSSPVNEILSTSSPSSEAINSSINPPSSNFRVLSMRVITLLLEENLINSEEEKELLHSSSLSSLSETVSNDSFEFEKKVHQQTNQFTSLENIPNLQHRIMQELSFIKLPQLANIDLESQFNPVDDSFRQLKCLQYCLRAVHAVNLHRKEIIYSFLKTRMASLEYYSILDELDKQIENSYSRKYKPNKKKRRNIPMDISQEFPELMTLVNRRNALVREFSSIVMPRNHISLPIPSEVFVNSTKEQEIAARFEIPTLSDADARMLCGVNEIVNESKLLVWPTNEFVCESSESLNKEIA